MRFSNILITKILLLVYVMGFSSFIMSQVPTRSDVLKYESDLLKKYQGQGLSPSQIQERYLLAAKKLLDVDDTSNAIYLLEKGFPLAQPSIEYAHIYLSILKRVGSQDKFFEIFKSTIETIKTVPKDDDLDLAASSIIEWLRLTGTLSSEVINKVFQVILNAAYIEDVLAWNDSIVLATRSRYDLAISILGKVIPTGYEEQIFVAYLQIKNKKHNTVCTSAKWGGRFLFEKTCKLLQSDELNNLEADLLKTGEIMIDTPLYEALVNIK
jgi:hypothetical protein